METRARAQDTPTRRCRLFTLGWAVLRRTALCCLPTRCWRESWRTGEPRRWGMMDRGQWGMGMGMGDRVGSWDAPVDTARDENDVEPAEDESLCPPPPPLLFDKSRKPCGFPREPQHHPVFHSSTRQLVNPSTPRYTPPDSSSSSSPHHHHHHHSPHHQTRLIAASRPSQWRRRLSTRMSSA